MKLYLIRHGESEANKTGLHSSPSTNLTAGGIRQAKAIAKNLKRFDIDIIYSSTPTRAIQTAKIISKALPLPIETWGKISEVRTPSINWGKKINDKTALEVEDQIAKNYSKGNWKHSDEETFEDIRLRAQKVLNHLLRKHKSQNVICVSHTSFIKMIILVAVVRKHLSPDVYLQFREHARIDNSGVSVLNYNKRRGWVLDTWNDTNHL